MRLYELTQPLTEVTAFQEKKLMNNDWKNPREVRNWLLSKNFEKKGSGQFSVALVHPGYKRIVKISKKQDECWLRFAHWTLRMTSHPNVPYISWVRKYGEDDKFFIAVVEKLAPFNRQAIMNTVDVVGLAYLYLREDWFKDDKQIERRLIKEGVIYNEDASYTKQLQRYIRNANRGKRFINVIRSSKKFAQGKCAYDMHDGNLMYRPSDRRLVVIDPLADLNQAKWF